MAPFDKLSNELILEILQGVDRTDLPNLCLSTQRLYCLTQPILYSTFKQTGKEEVPLFLRAIFAQPQLAKHVKNIQLTLLKPNAHGYTNIYISLSEQDHVWAKRQIQSAGYKEDYCNQWYEDLLEPNNWGALAALLVHLCSRNLETIDLIVGAASAHYIEYLFGLAAKRWKYEGVPYLSKLRRVRLLPPDEWGTYPRDAALAMDSHHFVGKVLQMKHLPELSLAELRADEHALWLQSGADTQRKLTIRKLSITCSILDRNFLKGFLERFNSLESLRYQRRKLYNGGESYLLIPAKVKEGLSSSKHSLKELVLQDPDYEWGKFDDDDIEMLKDSNLLGSMVDFTHLKILDVELRMLLGWVTYLPEGEEYPRYSAEQCINFAHGIPASLEHLILSECNWAIFDPLSELLFNSTSPPKLKTIQLVPNEFYDKLLEPVNDDRSWDDYVSGALEKGVVLQRYEWEQ